MDYVNLLARQYGFRALFVWYPNMAVGHKQLTPNEQQVLGSEYHKFPDLGSMYLAVYDRSREINRPNFYNLADLVDDRKDTLYKGISHMNAEGDQIVARRLFDILQHEGSVSTDSGVPSPAEKTSGRSIQTNSKVR
jgi:hypothetical protein